MSHTCIYLDDNVDDDDVDDGDVDDDDDDVDDDYDNGRTLGLETNNKKDKNVVWNCNKDFFWEKWDQQKFQTSFNPELWMHEKQISEVRLYG